MKVKVIIAKLLMAFVLVSIGFAVGKEVALRAVSDDQTDAQAEQAQDKVTVYYMHGTFRCSTCNSIESMAKEVVENDFGDALAEGRLEWKVVNFQENSSLARRYGVGNSTVVVAKLQDGKEVDFSRLDEVWKKLSEPDNFKEYIRQAINEYLDGGSA